MGLWVQPEVPVGWEATVRPVPPSSLALTRSCLGLGTLLVARSPLFPQSRCLGTRADPGNTGGQKQGVLETRSWKLTAGVSPEGLGASYSCDSFLELLCPVQDKKFILHQSGSQNPQIKVSAGWFLLEAPGTILLSSSRSRGSECSFLAPPSSASAASCVRLSASPLRSWSQSSMASA